MLPPVVGCHLGFVFSVALPAGVASVPPVRWGLRGAAWGDARVIFCGVRECSFFREVRRVALLAFWRDRRGFLFLISKPVGLGGLALNKNGGCGVCRKGREALPAPGRSVNGVGHPGAGGESLPTAGAWRRCLGLLMEAVVVRAAAIVVRYKDRQPAPSRRRGGSVPKSVW